MNQAHQYAEMDIQISSSCLFQHLPSRRIRFFFLYPAVGLCFPPDWYWFIPLDNHMVGEDIREMHVQFIIQKDSILQKDEKQDKQDKQEKRVSHKFHGRNLQSTNM